MYKKLKLDEKTMQSETDNETLSKGLAYALTLRL